MPDIEIYVPEWCFLLACGRRIPVRLFVDLTHPAPLTRVAWERLSAFQSRIVYQNPFVPSRGVTPSQDCPPESPCRKVSSRLLKYSRKASLSLFLFPRVRPQLLFRCQISPFAITV